MPPQTIKKFSDLKKRISRFLYSKSFARDEIRLFIDKIKPLGDVVIIGGMLRDLSILGNEGFKSDVDLVILTDDTEKLERTLSGFEFDKNKFGGYRIKAGKWYVDLWPFNSTWAFHNGHVAGKDFKDLCKTTFFNWDGIIYEESSGTIHAIDGYIDFIHDRVLDINLEPNPNPMGNVIKVFRYYEKYDAVLMPRLVNYVHQILKDISCKDIFLYEKKSHEWPLLDMNRVQDIYNMIESHQKHSPGIPFKPMCVQRKLWQADI